MRRLREYHATDRTAREAACACGWKGKVSEVGMPSDSVLDEYYDPQYMFPAGACPTQCGGSAYWIPGTGQSDSERVLGAIERLQDALRMLKLARCPKAVTRIRLALSSVKGAARNVNYRRLDHERRQKGS